MYGNRRALIAFGLCSLMFDVDQLADWLVVPVVCSSNRQNEANASIGLLRAGTHGHGRTPKRTKKHTHDGCSRCANFASLTKENLTSSGC